ncbi:AbrB/MazE/SpoVT family DNA-binding domain-containing protein [bacterium endosymbiont of Bathymodiolus sp. 5 South]|jgi:antitoxin MazE|uniref:AbrB/MazE/SpoVT family DNA-binding domain-containing protein n=1 Tax=bacterium endosymbiont of Bathymodiolus sp. 5 South TaxID=1181670 RepID=UPI0010B59C8F|nr:transcriptional regulator/antitoxin MazE [bacterium endosymbiont of Bathymodiolus sp. 5 South]CAC9647794.1 hypothetical protein [uncultured Gammaproteobacteria bacterium]CAC9658241.1 hypothetical protein [uncultured Gammaproteobacteria bacterium]SHN89579.1 hypothetical protein BCLUESOX_1441 [bacterium endosymbiont of Bathymodiolus sp. 5 South]SSC09001.1 hypothetical protein BTURTLESOX_1753 [bacterium endosymbiont of Bathymodiolus sp. 5 South]VVH58562.1 hypothetical protein BSPCLSOX_2275 [un
MQTTVSKWGNSAGLRLSKSITSQLHISIGDKLDINIDKGRIIIKPVVKKHKHNLDELLAQVPSDYQVSEVFSDTQGIEKL